METIAGVTRDSEPICVVIPFYNARETLRNAVFSVLNQSYPAWQLILLDDGSIDDSVETIIDLIDNNDSINLVCGSLNRGLIYRLNQMVEFTDAAYIARMDADDLMHPDRLFFQMRAFRNDPELDIVSTGMAVMNSDYQVMGVRRVDRQPTVCDFLRDGGLVHASCVFRREFLETNKYNSDFLRVEDRELFLRVIPFVKYRCVTKPLYFCLEYNRFSRRRYLESYRAERKVIRLHGPRLVGSPGTVFYLARSVMKSLLLYVLAALGLGERITRRASKDYSKVRVSHLQAIVDEILRMSRK